MNNLISQIHQDHVNMARILKLIESEVEALAAEELRDMEILDDTMQYMINYADKVHHAKEDRMFNRLQEKAPETRELIEEILQEHGEIYDKGTRFLELVQDVEFGDFVVREEIVSKGRDYVSTLFAHMSKEEDKLLKIAREKLSTDDIADLDLNEGGDDPVFGEKVLKQYKDLYEHILHQYGDDWLHPVHRLV